VKIAIVAPSAVPFLVGGAEKLWWGLLSAINQHTEHHAELIKLPSPEQDFWSLMDSYRAFSQLDLDHFDLVISTKYPAWMVAHRNHVCYLQHKLRGLYDTYHFTQLPTALPRLPSALEPLKALLERSRGDRSELEPLFAELARLREDRSLDGWFQLPSPLVRRIVHCLDGIGLAPAAIQRYLAISQTVAARADYFPPGAEVEVLHHPSDLPRAACTGYADLFTASRLDHPKRLHLLIDAFRQVETERHFRIAGTGPAEADLRARAEGDPRIEFLGHISDEQIIAEYGRALFVPFVPYDEDYGLITLEAMRAAKPVLTTTDAGGVNELVEHGRTGLSVAPEAPALAAGMRRLIANPAATQAMGEQARESVARIDWPHTLEVLLGHSSHSAPARSRGLGQVRNPTPNPAPNPAQGHRLAPSQDRVVPGAEALAQEKAQEPNQAIDQRHANPRATGRSRIVVAVDFPVYPPRGGGQARVYHLYRALARFADCTLITLCDDPAIAGRYEIAPGLTEQRIAKSAAHRKAAQRLDAELGASTGDIATLLYQHLTPAYAQAVAAAAADCHLLVASHPYLYPSIEPLAPPRLWYEAHNVELDMKCAVIGDGPQAARYLEQVAAAEGALCARADQVLVCTQADAARLAELYDMGASKCLEVPNGVDSAAVPFAAPQQRLSARQRLALSGRRTALFIGSWHQPNIAAVEALKPIAAHCPAIDFLVVGSVCGHPVMQGGPPNLCALGELQDAELALLLEAVDLALNPVTSGSGTNLKMLHYAAAGVPILATPFGNRGLCFQDGVHLRIASLEDFPFALNEMLADAGACADYAAKAREQVEARYDWSQIAQAVTARLL
jgi:glycosyltransferase involved in cell wall biosynthesis